MQELNSDKAIKLKENDRFQRYPFAQRIAKTIIRRKSDDCLTIGIYGAWGEGKTSVLNFIEQELDAAAKEENIVFFKFNPWRFTEEDKLLLAFFELLSNKVGKSLKSKGDKVKSLFKKYSQIVSPVASYIPVVGGVVEKVADGVREALGEKDIEEIKDDISEILKESKIKIVVAIDDIDRLDKDEIYAVLKMVKLTAGFSNMIYLLSFDDKMVASAIGERFGGTQIKAGFNFLEKIVHVPLHLPIAQPDALKSFCYEMIEKVIKDNEIHISTEEIGRLDYQFRNHILLRLKNPRLAVRFSNAVAFLLPMLADEVNHVDLILIEAVKIFYPQYYELIKTRPDFFLQGYASATHDFRKNEREGRITEYKNVRQQLNSDFNSQEKAAIQSLLFALFPRLEESKHVNSVRSLNDYEKWYNNKRVSSPKYFSRYFLYTVIDGEISDVEFTNFINISDTKNDETIISRLTKMVTTKDLMRSFIYKLNYKEKELSWEVKKGVVLAVLNLEELISVENQLFLGIGSTKREIVKFTYGLLRNQTCAEERFDFAKQILTSAKSYEYCYDLNNEFRYKGTEEDALFTNEKFIELAFIVLERAKSSSQDIPFFKKYSEKSAYLLKVWGEEKPIELKEYLKVIFDEDTQAALDLLKSFTPLIRSSSSPKPYPSDFTEDYYKYMGYGLDNDFIAEYLFKLISLDDLEKEPHWRAMYDENQSDLNLIRQFFYWHKKSKSAD